MQPPAPPVVPGGGESRARAARRRSPAAASPAPRASSIKDRTAEHRRPPAVEVVQGCRRRAIADFGTPQTTTGYALCVYDGSSRPDRERSTAPAGGTCRGKACWRPTANGFRYDDKDRTPDGVQRLDLKAGAAGKAQVAAAARRASIFTPPPLPISTLPVRVQLRSSSGQCWQSTHTTVLADTTTQFKAK